jgi:hypothetical protein
MTLSHVIVMKQKSGSTYRVKGQGFNIAKFYQNDKTHIKTQKKLNLYKYTYLIKI